MKNILKGHSSLTVIKSKYQLQIHNSQSIACQQRYQKCEKLLSTRIYPTYATVWFPFIKKSNLQSVRSQYEKKSGKHKKLAYCSIKNFDAIVALAKIKCGECTPIALWIYLKSINPF